MQRGVKRAGERYATRRARRIARCPAPRRHQHHRPRPAKRPRARPTERPGCQLAARTRDPPRGFVTSLLSFRALVPGATSTPIQTGPRPFGFLRQGAHCPVVLTHRPSLAPATKAPGQQQTTDGQHGEHGDHDHHEHHQPLSRSTCWQTRLPEPEPTSSVGRIAHPLLNPTAASGRSRSLGWVSAPRRASSSPRRAYPERTRRARAVTRPLEPPHPGTADRSNHPSVAAPPTTPPG